MRAHTFEIVEQPWRTVVRIVLHDPADKALQLFLNESPHRRTVAMLDSVLTGEVSAVTGGGDRMSFTADRVRVTITDRLADLMVAEDAVAEVALPTRELRDLVQALLDARAAHRP